MNNDTTEPVLEHPVGCPEVDEYPDLTIQVQGEGVSFSTKVDWDTGLKVIQRELIRREQAAEEGADE